MDLRRYASRGRSRDNAGRAVSPVRRPSREHERRHGVRDHDNSRRDHRDGYGCCTALTEPQS